MVKPWQAKIDTGQQLGCITEILWAAASVVMPSSPLLYADYSSQGQSQQMGHSFASSRFGEELAKNSVV